MVRLLDVWNSYLAMQLNVGRWPFWSSRDLGVANIFKLLRLQRYRAGTSQRVVKNKTGRVDWFQYLKWSIFNLYSLVRTRKPNATRVINLIGIRNTITLAILIVELYVLKNDGVDIRYRVWVDVFTASQWVGTESIHSRSLCSSGRWVLAWRLIVK